MCKISRFDIECLAIKPQIRFALCSFVYEMPFILQRLLSSKTLTTLTLTLRRALDTLHFKSTL